MKRTEKHKLVFESFDSYDEFVRTTKSRKVDPEWYEAHSRNPGDKKWTGEDSIEDARDHLLKGDLESFKRLKETQKGKIADGMIKNSRPTWYNDVQGYAPNVPNALKGLPQSMINMRMSPKKIKVFDVLVDVTRNCGVSVQEIADFGCELLSYIEYLERSGYRVRISAFMCFASEWQVNKKAHILKVKIKSENQPLDLKRVAYPLISAGMFRRLGFEWYETLPGHDYIFGYGQALHKWNDSDRKKELLENAKESGQEVYIYHNCDIKKQFGVEE